MNDPADKQALRINKVLLFLALLGGLAACLVMGAAGFAIGRLTVAAPDLQTQAPEIREVTRQVEVTPPAQRDDVEQVAGNASQDEEAATGEDVAESPAAPTPLPTTPPVETAEPLDLDSLDLRIFEEVWNLIQDDFYGDLPSNEDLLYSAIEGSLRSLDDEFTRFVRPEIATLLREDFGGSVEGIGAFVRENDDGYVEIVTPIDGQPADLAGLLPGDLIVAVDGESVVGQDFYAVIAKVRGPRGTQVTLTIDRPGAADLLEFTITRTRFEVPVIEAEMLPQNVAYVRLLEFSGLATEKLTQSLEELLAQNPQGIILDLRNNPGGFLDQSVMVADLFLPEGVVLYQRDSQGREEVFRSQGGDLAEGIPLVVLINPGSASASEIVAGAIQDRGRGTLIGETTFGKGSVQLLHVLSNGSELRVTVARWYTPNNNSIDGKGIGPDIEVAPDFESDEDEQLQRAIQYLLTGE